MKLITILIPAYNEEEVLPLLIQRLDEVTATLPTYSFEYLFINDGSKDRTFELLCEFNAAHPSVSVVNLSRNFGKEAAMLAGFDYIKGDAVVIIDADLQDPPELIPDMLAYWEEGYEDVFAKRKSRDGETFFKKWSSGRYYRILEKLSDVPVQRDTGDFRLLDRKCITALQSLRESKRYTKGMFSWIGFRKKEILFDRDARAAGDTKWNYLKLFNLALDGITSATIAPLRFASWSGIGISILAFLYIIFIVVRTILYGEPVAGYPSMMAVILFLGGVQLLSLGIIGEYLGKIFFETKKRPVYFLDVYLPANRVK
ncbi:glycosyltransferase family 2 protein [Chryseomicrobium sp. FSL W7-1435]|uniref:glycosyltransferase family 2 protein n=1 Tax=Chryseomicrobium sp. FSL W7-1435 TaxID=2921704 RepID=UPI00315AF488